MRHQNVPQLTCSVNINLSKHTLKILCKKHIYESWYLHRLRYVNYLAYYNAQGWKLVAQEMLTAM